MDWEKEAEEKLERAYRNPYKTGFKVLLWVIGLGTVLGMATCAMSVLGFFSGAASNAVQVAKKEFYPDALLRKYEWFKDAAAQLDKKSADIEVYRGRLTRMKEAYEGERRSAWPRDDREQYSIWESEQSGVVASYNSLAAEYNSQMAKFNWRFTNAGDVPEGGKPLPREFRTYREE